MADPRIDRLAEILVSYSCEIQPKDYVAIFGSPVAEPLMRSIFERVLRAGAYPYAFPGYDVFPAYGGFDDVFFREANEDQLRHVYRTDEMVLREFDSAIFLRSQRNTRNLTNVDPDKQRIRAQAYSDLNKVYFKRGASRELKWALTLYPTQAYAQDADMSLTEYADFVYGTCYADRDDAADIWQGIHDQQEELVDWLAGKKSIRVKGANVDMTLSIDGRKFVNADGKLNMPDGEIFTGPVENSVNGWVRFSYPAVHRGHEVNGVEFEFKDGRIEKATASKNQDFLMQMLDTDDGARFLGEWAIGTNDRIDRFTKQILFDEKIGGTIHMAVGRGYPETGSVNESGIHWDMICDMEDDGEIWVDDELFYRGGEFLVS
ncbi:MAG: aminopeptidase [Anaerolineales bacterium]